MKRELVYGGLGALGAFFGGLILAVAVISAPGASAVLYFHAGLLLIGLGALSGALAVRGRQMVLLIGGWWLLIVGGYGIGVISLLASVVPTPVIVILAVVMSLVGVVLIFKALRGGRESDES